MTQILLMLHPLLGMLAFIAAGWVCVDCLHPGETTAARIRTLSTATAVLMWATYLIAGYWYVVYYGPEKSIILQGPWPFAHKFVMETKEHIFFALLILGTYLPIAARDTRSGSAPARKLTGMVAGLIVLLTLMMEGYGAIISMGVKMGLLPH